MKIPYLDKKDVIYRELLNCAKSQPPERVTYTKFGERVGIPSRGPWKPILDLIGDEETQAGRPDVTYLVINKATGFPGQISFERAKPPSDEQKSRARQELQRIIERYSPGAENPY